MTPLTLEWVFVNYAVIFRYPGTVASKADAQKARVACRYVRRRIRSSFGLKT